MITDILNAIVAAGGQPYYAGGCVRDQLMGYEPKDFDIEVYGLPADLLLALLKHFAPVERVGSSFGVFKVRLDEDEHEYDFSLPRRESKAGRGHKGFMVEFDSTMTRAEACARRDFTINSLLEDPFTFEIFDYYGGVRDIGRQMLVATSPAFADDPLRVLRGMQLAARYCLTADLATVQACHSVLGEYDTLPVERIWVEWQKWAEKGQYAAKGLELLYWTGWIMEYPALLHIRQVLQDPAWHPEGDVWEHTLAVCDYMALKCLVDDITGDDRAVLMFAALLHDTGKADMTIYDPQDGRIKSPGHELLSARLAEEFLSSIGAPSAIIQRVVPLVAEHMAHVNTLSPRTVRRLAQRLEPATIRELCYLIEADCSGRPPLPVGLPVSGQILLEMSRDLKLEQSGPVPLVMGRHLIEMGLLPGPAMGQALKAAFEAQIEGKFDCLEDGLAWIAERFA